MAYYVPLGPRGLILGLGTFVIGLYGSVVYRLACRRRDWIAHIPHPVVVPVGD